MRLHGMCALLLVVQACSSKSDDDDSGAEDSAAGTTEPAGEDTSDPAPEGFPDQPEPFTVSVTGAYEGSLAFDTPTCSHRTGSTTFRQFWRGSGHVFVLVVEMFDTFPGEPGDYGASDGVRARLQEEAGGEGNYFASELGGDASTLTLDGFDTEANEAWGAATVGTLGDSTGGSVMLSPDSVPVWCNAME